MTALVSVIIPTFNKRHDLCRCVDSVLMQTSATTEIIVAMGVRLSLLSLFFFGTPVK